MAWHGFKYIDPAESGAVLPIVHVKGFKISERTIYGFRSRADGTEFWAPKGDANAALRSEIAGLRSKWAARADLVQSLGPCPSDAASPRTLQAARCTRVYGDRESLTEVRTHVDTCTHNGDTDVSLACDVLGETRRSKIGTPCHDWETYLTQTSPARGQAPRYLNSP
ncbi:hypothetical protein B0H14DRAFT_3855685 [Mycena olivaceomarginata]|nr:hypothetical protein B0H14DRAFT_3855685 [Mycena olivaceomarginata]